MFSDVIAPEFFTDTYVEVTRLVTLYGARRRLGFIKPDLSDPSDPSNPEPL